MGNSHACCCLDLTYISFEYKTTMEPSRKTINNLILKDENNIEIILEIVKEKDEKILLSLNRIKDQFKNIDEKKLISLRECLKHILSKIIKDKELMESYKFIIYKTNKNNLDLKNIKSYCDMFIYVYKKK